MTMMVEIRLVSLKYLKKLCIDISMQNLHAKTHVSQEFSHNKSSLLKNINKLFYCHLKMSFRCYLYESRDKIKNETGRFPSSLYM